MTFHRSWFAPEGTTVVVIGDVTPAAVIQVTERWFSPGVQSAAQSRRCPKWRARIARDLFVVPMMSKAQADVAYGVIGVRRADPGVL